MKRNGFLLSAIFIYFSANSVAQPGPYAYQPPEGTIRWADTTGIAHTYIPIAMNVLSPIPAGEDAIMVSFHVNLRTNENNKPLITFSLGGEDRNDNLIEITYAQNTFTVERYKELNSKRISYSYHLFDPLFEDIDTLTRKDWRVQVYITSSFMYYVVSVIGGEVRNFMSPLYFGLDDTYRYPNTNSNMYTFLNHYYTAIIKLGDQRLAYPPYVSDVTINTFVYDDFWRTVQREFSSPNPPSLSGTKYN